MGGPPAYPPLRQCSSRPFAPPVYRSPRPTWGGYTSAISSPPGGAGPPPAPALSPCLPLPLPVSVPVPWPRPNHPRRHPCLDPATLPPPSSLPRGFPDHSAERSAGSKLPLPLPSRAGGAPPRLGRRRRRRQSQKRRWNAVDGAAGLHLGPDPGFFLFFSCRCCCCFCRSRCSTFLDAAAALPRVARGRNCRRRRRPLFLLLLTRHRRASLPFARRRTDSAENPASWMVMQKTAAYPGTATFRPLPTPAGNPCGKNDRCRRRPPPSPRSRPRAGAGAARLSGTDPTSRPPTTRLSTNGYRRPHLGNFWWSAVGGVARFADPAMAGGRARGRCLARGLGRGGRWSLGRLGLWLDCWGATRGGGKKQRQLGNISKHGGSADHPRGFRSTA